MNDQDEKLDFLLEQNTNEQLAEINWEQLNDSISRGLDQVSRRKTSVVQCRVLFKVAAGIVIAAAVVVFSMLMETDTPEIQQNPDTPRVVVTFPQTRGSAVVEILDSNGKENDSTEQSSLMIIRKQKPKVLSDLISRDELDFACLL